MKTLNLQWFHSKNINVYRWSGSNRHSNKGTGFWVPRVCQFRHAGLIYINKKLPYGSNYGAEDRTCTYILFREGTYSKSWNTPALYQIMERKIGLTPISHSGKECVLKLNYSRIAHGGGNRIWTGDKGFADLCLTTWLCRQKNWASWIRTSAWRSQSPLPYRLAIAH